MAVPKKREKRTLDLNLFGQHFTVVSDNDAETVARIVEFVNQRLADVQANSGRQGTDQVALLAALTIAEELFGEREKTSALKGEVKKKSESLLRAVDAIARDLHTPQTTSGATNS